MDKWGVMSDLEQWQAVSALLDDWRDRSVAVGATVATGRWSGGTYRVATRTLSLN